MLDYAEHAIAAGTDATAVAYVEATKASGDGAARCPVWGVGVHESILAAGLRAVVGAVNRLS